MCVRVYVCVSVGERENVHAGSVPPAGATHAHTHMLLVRTSGAIGGLLYTHMNSEGIANSIILLSKKKIPNDTICTISYHAQPEGYRRPSAP